MENKFTELDKKLLILKFHRLPKKKKKAIIEQIEFEKMLDDIEKNPINVRGIDIEWVKKFL